MKTINVFVTLFLVLLALASYGQEVKMGTGKLTEGEGNFKPNQLELDDPETKVVATYEVIYDANGGPGGIPVIKVIVTGNPNFSETLNDESSTNGNNNNYVSTTGKGNGKLDTQGEGFLDYIHDGNSWTIILDASKVPQNTEIFIHTNAGSSTGRINGSGGFKFHGDGGEPIPLDGGLSFLLASGLGLGIFRRFKSKK